MSGLSLDSLDPGALAHKLVDSFLPKDMQWVGGLVGAAVDYQCGNPVGAAAQAASALSDMKDLPQSSTATKPAVSGSTAAANKASTSATTAASSQQWTYEPPPPQPRSTTTTTTTTTTITTGGPASSPTKPATPVTPTKVPSTLGANQFGSVSNTASLMRSLEAYVTAHSAPASTNSPVPGASSAPPTTSTMPSGDAPLVATKLMSAGDINQAYIKAHPATPATASGNPAATSPSKSPPAGAPPAATPTWRATRAETPPPSWRATPLSAAPTWRATPPTSTTTTTITTTTTTGSGPPAGSTPASSSPPGPGDIKSPLQSNGGSAATSAQTGTSKTAATPATSKTSNVDPSTLSKDNFMKLSDDDLMTAVRAGQIPSDVTDSQEGMMALQARMNHISEMNQMMTTMMQSMHQMKMSVIDNLKV